MLRGYRGTSVTSFAIVTSATSVTSGTIITRVASATSVTSVTSFIVTGNRRVTMARGLRVLLVT